jgi:transcriptional regulator with XRE-family HTH domain
MEQVKFSANLREALTTHEMTQKQLANQLGTTQQSVSRWLTGVTEPDLTLIYEICKCLGETPNRLLGFEDDFGNVVGDVVTPKYELSPDELELVKLFRHLPEIRQSTLIDTMKAMVGKVKKSRA